MNTTIHCRARLSDRCYHGRPASEVYDSGDQREDGTYRKGTVVCDACYVEVGLPDLRDLDAAVTLAWERRARNE